MSSTEKPFNGEEYSLTDVHNLGNLVLTLYDSRSRILWISGDPSNHTGLAGQSFYELWPFEEHKRFNQAFNLCTIHGERVGFIAPGPDFPPRQGKYTIWRVTLAPIDIPSLPSLVAVSFGSRLPSTISQIGNDEKELLQFLCEDLTLKQIAGRMLLSESAIDAKMRRLKEKFGSKTIGGLVSAALSHAVI